MGAKHSIEFAAVDYDHQNGNTGECADDRAIDPRSGYYRFPVDKAVYFQFLSDDFVEVIVVRFIAHNRQECLLIKAVKSVAKSWVDW